VTACAGGGAEAGAWARFAAHWDDLAPDPYAAATTGTRRMRRYGTFRLTRDGRLSPRSHDAFVRPESGNPICM
jgi:hypothetical protein